ncbi:hypothetical protein DFJ74DRAFT_657906 [Hyaloraphidium curvatum]|nr:hypothetical protein DFJ74DRAFT_657906 [Hyaloraphidium curvatum]
MDSPRKRAAARNGTPNGKANGANGAAPNPKAVLAAKARRKKDEEAISNYALAVMALGVVATGILIGVFLKRDELGLTPLLDELFSRRSDIPTPPPSNETCIFPVPHDFACEGSCPFPAPQSSCAERYERFDTVAEMRMVDRKPALSIVSAAPAAGSVAKHEIVVGPVTPHDGGKLGHWIQQPPTGSCANVVHNVTIASTEPYVIVIDGFLTDSEIEHAMKLGMPGLQQSGQFHGDEETKKAFDASYRTSSTSYLSKSADPIVTCIERRVASFSGYDVRNFESLQFLRYEIAQEYKWHWDYFPKGYAAWDAEIAKNGQRTVTFFLYLNDLPGPDAGGETAFQTLNIKVQPKRGRAVFWYDTLPDGEGDARTYHAGLPVKEGTKYAINAWGRDRPQF